MNLLTIKMYLITVDLMKFDDLVNELEKSIKNYHNDPCEKTKQILKFDAMAVVLKDLIKQEGIDNVMNNLKTCNDILMPIMKNLKGSN